MRLGLQGKLISAFMLILSFALGSTCWLFVSQSNDRLEDIMGEQARQISYALALASKPSLEGKETGEAIGDAIRLAIAACPVTGSVATPAV